MVAKHTLRRVEVKKLSTLASRRRKLKGVIIAASCACALVLFVLISRYDGLQIKNIIIEGATHVSGEDIKKKIESILSGNYPLWIPKNNTLFLPRSAISAAVLADYLPLEGLTIHRTGLNSLSVEVSERPLSYLWYGDVPNDINECYFVDGSGLIFQKGVTVESGGPLIIYAPHQGGLLGGQVLTRQIFVNTLALFAVAERAGIVVNKIVANDVEINLYTKDDWVIYAPNDMRISSASGVLDAALHSRAFTKDTAFNNLEYIDLRYSPKVYYKYGESNPAP